MIIFLSLWAALILTAWGAPRLRPGGTSPDTTGEDMQSNIGSIITNPATTNAPTAQRNAPVLVPEMNDTALESQSVHTDETPPERDQKAKNKLEATLNDQSKGSTKINK